MCWRLLPWYSVPALLRPINSPTISQLEKSAMAIDPVGWCKHRICVGSRAVQCGLFDRVYCLMSKAFQRLLHFMKPPHRNDLRSQVPIDVPGVGHDFTNELP